MAIELEVNTQRITAALTIHAPWVTLFGPSGSGKSSLLRLIAGLWQPPHSRVIVGARDVTKQPAHLRRATLLSQHPKLFPNMTVQDNVLFASREKHAVGHKEATAIMEALHIQGLATRRPASISGGEQQRTTLARALVARPQILLLDETFSGADTTIRTAVVAMLKSWQSDTGAQIISVTHDTAEALQCADEVIKLQDGKVIAQGPTAEVLAAERVQLLAALGNQTQPPNKI